MAKGETEKNFKGINWLTGRKIYLSPKEEAVIKKQNWKLIKTLLWIFGIYILLKIILFVFAFKI